MVFHQEFRPIVKTEVLPTSTINQSFAEYNASLYNSWCWRISVEVNSHSRLQLSPTAGDRGAFRNPNARLRPERSIWISKCSSVPCSRRQLKPGVGIHTLPYPTTHFHTLPYLEAHVNGVVGGPEEEGSLGGGGHLQEGMSPGGEDSWPVNQSLGKPEIYWQAFE